MRKVLATVVLAAIVVSMATSCSTSKKTNGKLAKVVYNFNAGGENYENK